MNIHLPAILMFTRGTRFWHTATWWDSLFHWNHAFDPCSFGFIWWHDLEAERRSDRSPKSSGWCAHIFLAISSIVVSFWTACYLECEAGQGQRHDREQSLSILRFTACGWSNLRNENNNFLSDGWGYSIPQVGPELCALHGHVCDGCFFFQSSISTHGCQSVDVMELTWIYYTLRYKDS